jgi:small subunit ribosomal protein S6
VSRDYELGFILNPEVNEEQTRTILERVETIVTNNGGQFVSINKWGRKRLSYQIDHHRDGFYVFVDFILPAESVSEVDRTLKVTEEVLRHLIIKQDPKNAQQKREARANAAAQAEQAAAEAAAKAENAAAETPTEVVGEAEAVEAVEAPLKPDEEEFVPPAIEDEAVEA